MIKKLKAYMLTMSSLFLIAVPVLVPSLASAAATACTNDVQSGIAKGAGDATGHAFGCDSTGVDNDAIGTIGHKIVNVFSIIVGAAAVIMIIYGGFRYITSGGDSGRVGSAKNSLIYAIVGLVVVALAQIIVHFVLNQATTITNP